MFPARTWSPTASSFVSDQFQPNNIHILAGKSSRFFITFDYAHLRRKGKMTRAAEGRT
ncbi:MAG: hypothetical protein U5P10_08975 [Spirochaetia bacterium]|nr:hypothetical protein [Spirochaetia bacterium]